MQSSQRDLESPPGANNLRRILVGVAGVLIGGVFLWLAMRRVDPNELWAALHQMDGKWLTAGVAVYLAAIGARCLRWGILLRATGSVKWRHATEALITGFAANYILPGRVGELFRADYARRVFNISRFTALGTIVVERVCDGIVLVCALWIGFAWMLSTRVMSPEKTWIFLVAAVSSLLFGLALVFVLVSHRLDLRRLGVGESIAVRWDLLIDGVSSVLRGHATIIVVCSIGVWILEAIALAGVVRSFQVTLTPPETLVLLGLASLSTLVPTAPGYVGTYQLVFGHVFQIFGYPVTIGIIAATAVQIFCFGTVTILGGIVLVSRSGLTIWRAHKWAPPEGS
jgi:glycosyltransferase 2 family protein